MKKTVICIVGSGNTAFTLAEALFSKGYPIHQIVSRNKTEAEKLAKKVKAKAANLESADLSANVIIVCVADDAIESVAGKMKSFKGLMVHTSGSVSINALPQKNTAVLYPFISMKKGRKADLKNAKIFIEAKDKTTLTIVRNIAKDLSNNVKELNSEQRLHLHLAAVFAHNFVNHQMALAQMILEKQNLSFDLLRNLTESYFQQLKYADPMQLQTGPAVRNDKGIIRKHLELLKDEKDFSKIYKTLTASIQKTYLHD